MADFTPAVAHAGEARTRKAKLHVISVSLRFGGLLRTPIVGYCQALSRKFNWGLLLAGPFVRALRADKRIIESPRLAGGAPSMFPAVRRLERIDRVPPLPYRQVRRRFQNAGVWRRLSPSKTLSSYLELTTDRSRLTGSHVNRPIQ